MKRFILLVGLVVSCSINKIIPRHTDPSDYQCMTDCGLFADTNCSALQAIEDETLKALDETKTDVSRAEMCRGLAGWVIVIHRRTFLDDLLCHGDSWYAPWIGVKCLQGLANGLTRTIEIPSDDYFNAGHGALVHEFFHVPALESSLRNGGHCNWEQRGYKQVILSVTGYWDFTSNEDNCPKWETHE